MHRTVHLSLADTGDAEREALERVGRSSWFSSVGPEIDAFEEEIASRVGRRHAVATCSGTAALHLALLAAGVGPGTTVVTSSFTFAATANAVHHAGATPFFVDVDPATGNLCPHVLDQALTELAADGTRVSAVLPVDIFGKAVDHGALTAVARHHGVPIVSDSAQSLGSRRDGVAAPSFGIASAISFNGNKIITTAGGGMLTTDDAELASLARHLGSQARVPARHFEHSGVGWNHRLSNVLAAVGRAQLARLDEMVSRRQEVREAYRQLLSDVPGVDLFAADDDADDNCWLSTILIDPATGTTPDTVADRLASVGIESRPLWKPLHRQPAFATSRSLLTGTSDRLFARGLALPSGSSLDADDLDHVLTTLSRALRPERRSASPLVGAIPVA